MRSTGIPSSFARRAASASRRSSSYCWLSRAPTCSSPSIACPPSSASPKTPSSFSRRTFLRSSACGLVFSVGRRDGDVPLFALRIERRAGVRGREHGRRLRRRGVLAFSSRKRPSDSDLGKTGDHRRAAGAAIAASLFAERKEKRQDDGASEIGAIRLAAIAKKISIGNRAATNTLRFASAPDSPGKSELS